MINNIKCTEIFSSSRGWQRVVKYKDEYREYEIECSDRNMYEHIIEKLLDGYKQKSYQRIVYKRRS